MIEDFKEWATPQRRVQGAVAVFWLSVVAWPLTSLTIFSKEPQGVLALSWIAIILEAVIIVITTDVRKEQDSD